MIKIHFTRDGYLSSFSVEGEAEEVKAGLDTLVEGSIFGKVAAAVETAKEAIKDVVPQAPVQARTSNYGGGGGGNAGDGVKPQPDGPVPSCAHGPREWKSGISKKSGKPYAFWACSNPDWKNGNNCAILSPEDGAALAQGGDDWGKPKQESGGWSEGAPANNPANTWGEPAF